MKVRKFIVNEKKSPVNVKKFIVNDKKCTVNVKKFSEKGKKILKVKNISLNPHQRL